VLCVEKTNGVYKFSQRNVSVCGVFCTTHCSKNVLLDRFESYVCWITLGLKQDLYTFIF
jgi:hypothetical protein